MIDSDLLIVLNGYNYSNDYDDSQLESLSNQSNKNFSLLFLDPFSSDIRRDKIRKFGKNNNIQSIHMPYVRDHRPRFYDWCTRNVGFMFMDAGRVFNFWQHRVIHKDIVNFIKKDDLNVSFGRIWYGGDMQYISSLNGKISLNINDKIYTRNIKNSCIHGDIVEEIHDRLFYCFYDCALRVDDFLLLKGTDEALTSYAYEEDWDIELRWEIAKNLLHKTRCLKFAMIYFGKTNRDRAKLMPPSQNSPCAECKDKHLRRSNYVNHKIGIDKNVTFLGMMNDIEWYKCINCGLLWPVVGNGFEAFSERKRKNKSFESTIGLSGYGRNILKIRKDVLKSGSIDSAIELINNSWRNDKYYE